MAEKRTTNMLECCNAFVYRTLIQWKDFVLLITCIDIDNVTTCTNSVVSSLEPKVMLYLWQIKKIRIVM